MTETVLRGRVKVPAKVELQGLRCDGTVWPDLPSIVTLCSPDVVVPHLLVPVATPRPGAALRQQTTDGWTRTLKASSERVGHTSYTRPVLLSARTNWTIEGPIVKIVGTAYVVEGAHRLEVAAAREPTSPLILVVVAGLSPHDELELRNQIIPGAQTPAEPELAARVGSDTPRLVVGTKWESLVVLSDPFVVPTAMGYAPAVIVRRARSRQAEHLLLGARSLAGHLEDIRRRNGSLVGAAIELRRDGDEKTARYEVRDLGRPA